MESVSFVLVLTILILPVANLEQLFSKVAGITNGTISKDSSEGKETLRQLGSIAAQLLSAQEKCKANTTAQPTNEQSCQLKDCDDVTPECGRKNGTFQITTNGTKVQVYCEFVGGDSWLVIQRRYSGKQDFYLDWNSYTHGFGNLEEEFWLGLETLHRVTSTGSYKLRVELETWKNETAYAEYSTFAIDDSETSYRLNIGNFSGTAGDSLTSHNNQPFSTNDHDLPGRYCAQAFQGAWWYNNYHYYCYRYNSNLNGAYCAESCGSCYHCMTWGNWKGLLTPLKMTKMKIKRN